MGAFVAFCASVVIGVNAGLPDAPVMADSARVKQHRAGAQGDLVAGEEEMRKIIVYWNQNSRAKKYEACHGCRVVDATGVREGDSGRVIEVDIDETCNDNMCLVVKNAKKGKNRFNVRVQTNAG